MEWLILAKNIGFINTAETKMEISRHAKNYRLHPCSDVHWTYPRRQCSIIGEKKNKIAAHM